MCPREEISFEDVLKDPRSVRNLSAGQIMSLLRDLGSLFKKEEALVRIARPRRAVFVGDTHGDFLSTVSIVSKEFLPYEEKPYLVFLGDYVDRGAQDVANFNLVGTLKLLFPERVVMLRGNHESEEMNRIYGFYRSATMHPYVGKEGFRMYQETFAEMPLAVFLEWNRVFGVHGGIPFDPHHGGPYTLEELQALKKERRFEDMPDVSRQMLWGDPREDVPSEKGYEFNFMRGMGYLYGRPVFDEFVERNDISLVVKSHQMFQEGHQFFFDRRLLSLFSTKHYSGYDVDAHIARIDQEGHVELVPV